MNRICFLVSWIVCLVAGSGICNEVPVDSACLAASNWLDTDASPLPHSVSPREIAAVHTISDETGETLFYALDLTGGGFLVVSADTSITPIMACSDTGAWDADGENPLRAFLTADLASRREAIRRKQVLSYGIRNESSLSSGRSAEEKWEALLSPPPAVIRKRSIPESVPLADIRVPPLIQSRWGQSNWRDPNTQQLRPTFNYYTPNRYLCGCVATAFAQVMRYWCEPKREVVPGAYFCWVDGVLTKKTMIGGRYDWEKMPLTRVDCTDEEQREAIGKLLFDLGVASRMQWTKRESITYSRKAGISLRNRFGYASACMFYSGIRLQNLAGVCRDAILASLDAGMPVVIGIQRGAAGHAVVVDGYGYNGSDTIYCHINFGYSGTSDAWYNLVGENVTSENYTQISDVIYNIHPSLAGDVFSGRVLNSFGEPVADAEVRLSPPSGAVMSTRSNENGIYAFHVTRTGDYTISAVSGALSSGGQRIPFPARSTNSTLQETDTTIDAGGSPGSVANRWGIDLTLRASQVTLQQALGAGGLAFSSGGNAAWSGIVADTRTGRTAAQSGAVANNQSSWLRTTVVGPGVLSFRWRISSEKKYDKLAFTMDNQTIATISGDTEWATVSRYIAPGVHTVQWTYAKDKSLGSGKDCAWVESLVWEETLPASPGSFRFVSGGGSGTVTVSENPGTRWRVTSATEWIAPQTTGGTGSGTFVFKVAKNDTDTTRTGQLRVAATTERGEKETTISITQIPAPQLSVSNTSVSISAKSGRYETTVEANQSWSASADVPWITLARSSGKEDEHDLVYQVEANRMPSAREGRITVTTGCASETLRKTVVVRQRGASKADGLWLPTGALRPKKTTEWHGKIFSGDTTVALLQVRAKKTNAKGLVTISAKATRSDGKKFLSKAISVKAADSPRFIQLTLKKWGTIVLYLGADGMVGTFGNDWVESARRGGPLRRTPAAFTAGRVTTLNGIPPLIDCLPDGATIRTSGTRWTFEKNASIKYRKIKEKGSSAIRYELQGINDPSHPNVTCLKLNYQSKYGTFSGSFKLYTVEKNLLKRWTFRVTGVVADGIGSGVATCKNSAPNKIAVRIE